MTLWNPFPIRVPWTATAIVQRSLMQTRAPRGELARFWWELRVVYCVSMCGQALLCLDKMNIAIQGSFIIGYLNHSHVIIASIVVSVSPCYMFLVSSLLFLYPLFHLPLNLIFYSFLFPYLSWQTCLNFSFWVTIMLFKILNLLPYDFKYYSPSLYMT